MSNPTPVGTFQVRNGEDGTGVGDMVKADYDTNEDGKVNDADHADSADTATTAANAEKLGGQLPSYYAAAEDIPTSTSDLTNDSGFITTETDPTVPSWAKQPTKPTYTASEVGAITSADIVNKADLVNGKVPEGQLPSYVDDVLEYDSIDDFPQTGENGKIYIAIDTNLTYRWGGTGYVAINSALALGETSSTAYRGDRGKTAYDHSQITAGNPHGTTAANIGAAELQNGKIIENQIPDNILASTSLANIVVINDTLAATTSIGEKIYQLGRTLTYPQKLHIKVTLANFTPTGTGEVLTIRLYGDPYAQEVIEYSASDNIPSVMEKILTINEDPKSMIRIRYKSSTSAVVKIEIEEITHMAVSSTLPDDGYLENDVMYIVTDPVDEYEFDAAELGWTHGVFTTGSNPNISFYGLNFIGGTPTFEPNRTYEFDILNCIWISAEVKSV